MTNFANRKTSRRLRMCRLRRARLSAAGDKGPRGTVHRVFCRNFFFIVVSENVRVILRRDLLSVKNVAENYNTTFFFISTEQLQNRRGKSFERYCYAKFVRFFFFVRYVFILRQRVRRKLPYTINGSRLFRTTTACVSRRVCAIKRVYFFKRSTVRKKRRALVRRFIPQEPGSDREFFEQNALTKVWNPTGGRVRARASYSRNTS